MAENIKKITFKAWSNLHEKFKKSLKTSCIQRDLYLDIVLKHEAKMLDKELSSPNSPQARLFLKQNLQRLDSTPISLALSEETVNVINDVCDRNLVPRDSFINRVMLFLILSRDHFGFLLGIDVKWFIENRLLADYGNEMAFEATAVGLSLISQSIVDDPFWTIRRCIDYANQDESGSADLLHSVFIDEYFAEACFKDKEINLKGLNCSADDFRIEGTKENEDWLHMFDDLLQTKPDSVKNRKR